MKSQSECGKNYEKFDEQQNQKYQHLEAFC